VMCQGFISTENTYPLWGICDVTGVFSPASVVEHIEPDKMMCTSSILNQSR